MSGSDGGLTAGVTKFLAEVDPETLPEDDAWREVARRAEAWREGRDGWRTGDIQSQLGESAEVRRCRS